MVLEVRDGENIPADLLCLHCPHPDNVAFIKTVNLDGAAHPTTPWPCCHFPVVSVFSSGGKLLGENGLCS